MRLRSGVQGHGKQAASVIIVFSRSKLTISWTTSTLTQARMFVGNNPDQQMMHAHYNFKAPLKFHTTKQGQTLIFFCGLNFLWIFLLDLERRIITLEFYYNLIFLRFSYHLSYGFQMPYYWYEIDFDKRKKMSLVQLRKSPLPVGTLKLSPSYPSIPSKFCRRSRLIKLFFCNLQNIWALVVLELEQIFFQKDYIQSWAYFRAARCYNFFCNDAWREADNWSFLHLYFEQVIF